MLYQVIITETYTACNTDLFCVWESRTQVFFISGVIEEEKAILEIKCFPSLARNGQDIFSAAKERKNFPLSVDGNGVLQINKKHNYYYQVSTRALVTDYIICTDKVSLMTMT